MHEDLKNNEALKNCLSVTMNRSIRFGLVAVGENKDGTQTVVYVENGKQKHYTTEV